MAGWELYLTLNTYEQRFCPWWCINGLLGLLYIYFNWRKRLFSIRIKIQSTNPFPSCIFTKSTGLNVYGVIGLAPSTTRRDGNMGWKVGKLLSLCTCHSQLLQYISHLIVGGWFCGSAFIEPLLDTIWTKLVKKSRKNVFVY